MLQHAIAPTRFFSQTPNDIIRHPRLNALAVRLLQWALSLPPGSRETIQTIGEKMPEGRIALRNARKQLEAEGYVHTQRDQDPTTGRWTTQVLVSNVPLRTPDEIAAAFSPTGTPPPVGVPAPRAVGASPQGENTEVGNTPHPEFARAAKLLADLGDHEPRLRLSFAEACRLAPLAAQQLGDGVTERALRTALTADLPAKPIHTPAGFLTHRLALPRPTPPPKPAPRAECALCRDPLPHGQTTGICTPCTGLTPPQPTPLTGPALARAALGPRMPRRASRPVRPPRLA
ncbi:hypothetical protein [Streptomyces sp. NBC_01262]|uniref:hypothetical protein n=1 Tax=Streptomyces sp. NBC_01262 TaxID=2903803 RepID=UPI002E32B793|nr:hypothetical protein [Streptomyces sp. NBC_01262]